MYVKTSSGTDEGLTPTPSVDSVPLVLTSGKMLTERMRAMMSPWAASARCGEKRPKVTRTNGASMVARCAFKRLVAADMFENPRLRPVHPTVVLIILPGGGANIDAHQINTRFKPDCGNTAQGAGQGNCGVDRYTTYRSPRRGM